MSSPFDFINAVSQTKKDIFAEDPQANKDYVPYIINKGLSYFTDTVLYANELNRCAHLDHDMQFYYLINSIRPQKRYAKWVKKISEDDLELVKVHYGYNDDKARQAMSILSDDQIKLIRKSREQGGTK